MRLMNVHDHVNYVSLRNIGKKVIISCKWYKMETWLQ